MSVRPGKAPAYAALANRSTALPQVYQYQQQHESPNAPQPAPSGFKVDFQSEADDRIEEHRHAGSSAKVN